MVVGVGIRVIGGRAAGAAIGAGLRRVLGPTGGTIAGCLLTGYCSFGEDVDSGNDNVIGPGDEWPGANGSESEQCDDENQIVGDNQLEPANDCASWKARVLAQKENQLMLFYISEDSLGLANLNYEIAAYNNSCQNLTGRVQPLLPDMNDF